MQGALAVVIITSVLMAYLLVGYMVATTFEGGEHGQNPGNSSVRCGDLRGSRSPGPRTEPIAFKHDRMASHVRASTGDGWKGWFA